MQRDLNRLSTRHFDLVVVGGGIYGACVAWDAVLRGLSVALIEQGDFGHATSANSQKIVHGGFRYLQHGDVKRMRESIRERRALMRIAPHLVHPLPVLIPTYRHGLQRRPLMWLALAAYDLIAHDRNHGVQDPHHHILRSRLLSRTECLQLEPGLEASGVTGGAIWYDGQVYNSERLTLAFLRSAAESGACVANYVRVTGFLQEDHCVSGVTALDVLSGRTLHVRGRLVVNTSGPWINKLLGYVGGQASSRRVPFSKTINIVTRPLTQRYALSVMRTPQPSGASHNGHARRLFITPWRDRAIVGTAHTRCDGDPDACRATSEEITALVDALNAAYPAAALRAEEVSLVHVGLMPLAEAGPEADPSNLAHRYEIRDHERLGGLAGLISVLGVKYTTARDIAEKTVNLAMRKLGRPLVVSRSAQVPVWGGRIERFEEFLVQALRERPFGLADETIWQLVRNYGSDYRAVLKYIHADPGLGRRLGVSSGVIRAEVSHAVREELALTLPDVVFRRTELGTAGHPGADALETCAALMAQELGWDLARTARELEDTEAMFTRCGARATEVAGAGR